MMEELLGTLRFAAEKHRDQRRKDSGSTPYINHPIAVAELLARVGKVDNLEVLQAAILHDTIEDTATTAQELDERFGQRVRRLVEEVTDDKRLPKGERKRLQIEHSPHLSPSAKAIKLADKISNLCDISSTQPPDWSLQRKLEYVDWACQVVDGCRGSHPELERLFDQTVEERRRELGFVSKHEP